MKEVGVAGSCFFLLPLPGLTESENGSLVGGFNPVEKYACQIGNLPQVGVKIKNIWNHQFVMRFGGDFS